MAAHQDQLEHAHRQQVIAALRRNLRIAIDRRDEATADSIQRELNKLESGRAA